MTLKTEFKRLLSQKAFSPSRFCFSFTVPLTGWFSPALLFCSPLLCLPGFLTSCLRSGAGGNTLPKISRLLIIELNANCLNITLTLERPGWKNGFHICSHCCMGERGCGAKCFSNEFTKGHYQGARSLETFIQNMVIVRTRCLFLGCSTFGKRGPGSARGRESKFSDFITEILQSAVSCLPPIICAFYYYQWRRAINSTLTLCQWCEPQIFSNPEIRYWSAPSTELCPMAWTVLAAAFTDNACHTVAKLLALHLIYRSLLLTSPVVRSPSVDNHAARGNWLVLNPAFRIKPSPPAIIIYLFTLFLEWKAQSLLTLVRKNWSEILC